jgi:peptidoglycan/xylan/chitin deacetylase (PgdA/CDA1 family)
VEAINCELYPAAVAGIAARGHELALHGWRHEAWAGLPAAREDALLARGRAAYAALGVDVRGFRPPGGDPTARTADLLAERSFDWISPAGSAPRLAGALAEVPFQWTLVDALHRLPAFAGRRDELGLGAGVASPGTTADRLARALAVLRDAEGPRSATLVLHPFLMIGEDAFAAAAQVLRAVRDLAGDGVSVRPVADIAASLRGTVE